ncbi:hypothetical protein D1AOALGA4SA_6387 [Olavius algarvensis Delta 1 endosymbiont]|nr:hypothetical protein D1AOALGA4SA_6387 [Olavius algarvensis Delta 1 endosymbiont]
MNHSRETDRLLVPIHIDALAVGEILPDDAMFQWTDLAPDFWKLQKEKRYFFGSELYSLFDEKSGPGVGIHLHFRLPRTFVHGSQTGAADILFPAIPNRWLLQRFGGEPGKPYTHQAWLIKSDAEAQADTDGIPWPTFHENEPLELKKIGTCTDLTAASGVEDEPVMKPPITAVGQGNPAFSAYYPACRSMLGFHDPMNGISAGVRLSYLVTGWYAVATDDPLHASAWSTGLISRDAETNFRAKENIPVGAALNVEQRAKLLSELKDVWFEERGWKCDGLEREFEGKDLGEALAAASARLGIPEADLPYEIVEPGRRNIESVRIRIMPSGEPPSRILCHGLVRGITWRGPKWNYFEPGGGAGDSVSGRVVFPPNTAYHNKAYNVSVGNTPAEALAALLTRGDVEQDLLTALPADLLGQGVTAAELRYELHARRFGGVHGGTTFSIQAVADRSPVHRAGDSHAAPRLEPPVVPIALRKLLRELNERQGRCDHLAREIEDCRWQVFALWYLWTNEYKSRIAETDPAKKDKRKKKEQKLASQLETFKLFLEEAKKRWLDARKYRDEIYTPEEAPDDSTGSIIDELTKYPKSQPDGSLKPNEAGKSELKYRVVATAARPFYKTSEPVIAVSGPATATLDPWEQSGRLACRLSGQVVTGLKLQDWRGSKHEVTGGWLVKKLFSNPAPAALTQTHGMLHSALLVEALLLDEWHADDIVEWVSAQVFPASTKEESKNFTKTVKAVQDRDPATPLHSTPNAPVGRLPSRVAESSWQRNPWIPLFLVWEVSWQSAYQPSAGQPLPEDMVTKRWRLDRGGDLVPKENAAAATADSGTSYRGYTLLTPSASVHLAKCLEALDESHPLIDILKNQNVQLQMLDGFNDALTLQKTGMQLPPLGYRKWRQTRGNFHLDPIHVVFNQGFEKTEKRDTFRTAPDTFGKKFFPIRAGQLKIERLSIVDAFGQTLKLPVNTINESAMTSDTMLHPAHSCLVGSAITLRPRFAQPMRLRFDWESASRGAGENGGPVCGWILPNHLEKSLTIYAASGKPLGALQKKLGQTSAPAFYWMNVPGGTFSGYSGRDLIDLSLLASKLEQPSDGITLFLRAHLSAATLEFLANSQESKSDPGPLQFALLKDLDRIINGPSLYVPQRFAGIALRPETQQLLSQNPQGDALLCCNRLLLEDAYPLIENIHLRHFCGWALSLSHDGGADFSRLVSESIASADQRVPDDDPGVSVLVGRPLALVRASLRFETAGLPAHNPELRADTGAKVSDPPGTNGFEKKVHEFEKKVRDVLETSDFEKVKWPLRLGDLHTRNDGLVGLFRCSPADTGSGVAAAGLLYPAWGLDESNSTSAEVFATQDFLIDCVKPLHVALLMDPQARVHATTGTLPRVYRELPREDATGAKRAREVFFQTAPVLGPSPTPRMPRPSDDYGEWSWAYQPDVTHWKLDPNLVEATDRGGFANAWPTIAEGWLKLAIAQVKVLSFWVREGTEEVSGGTPIHLAWSLQAAESLELAKVKLKDGEQAVGFVKRWDAPPFPREYTVTVDEETTYRIIASAADAQPDARDLTVKIKQPGGSIN